MKKFFIGLGIFFVLAGIVFCVADTKDTSCLLYTSDAADD